MEFSVLILDDDEEWLKLHAFNLLQNGYRPICTQYGNEALNIIQNDKEHSIRAAIIDEILVDPHKPYMKQDNQGSHYLLEIKRMRDDILCIMVSGASEKEEDPRKGLNLMYKFTCVAEKVFPKFILKERYDELINYLAEKIRKNRFCKHGNSWIITFAGLSVTLEDDDGLKYIFHLISNPNKEIHSMELIRIVKGTSPVNDSPYSRMSQDQIAEYGLSISRHGDAGHYIDKEAKQAYKEKVLELKEEIEEAEQIGNVEKAEELKEERDKIIDQLKHAFDKFGRLRRVGKAGEKARQVVSKAIHRSLRKINKEHKELSAHLSDGSLHIGLYNSYNPKQPISWILS